jgi:hypothetical protein
VAAPQYIDYVMTFTQRTVSDETIFPTKYGKYFKRIINYRILLCTINSLEATIVMTLESIILGYLIN